LLSSDLGRLFCIAKSAQRSKRRFGGCLNLFSEVEAEITIKKNRDSARLESCVLIDSFDGIQSCLENLRFASAGAELIDRLVFGPDGADSFFRETESFLKSISSGFGSEAFACFELRTLSLAGFQPELEHCVICGRETSDRDFSRLFDFNRGGLLCPQCSNGIFPFNNPFGEITRISNDARTRLLFILSGNYTVYTDSKNITSKECHDFIDMFLEQKLGHSCPK